MNHKQAVRKMLDEVFKMAEEAYLTEYDGREVINVEETLYDAIEIGYAVTAPEGYFVEPINHCLLAVWTS
jgi:hypothetical protein